MKIDISYFLPAVFAVGLFAGCATEPPPLPPNNPANPQVRDSTKWPPNLLVQDETTLAIQKELSATEAEAKRAKTMQHEMQNMLGMPNGQMQHGGTQQLERKTLTCPMHPEIRADSPGDCRICGMNLVPKKEGTP